MTHRKAVMTSASAVEARPKYVPSMDVVDQVKKKRRVLAKPVRAAERSEADVIRESISRARVMPASFVFSSESKEGDKKVLVNKKTRAEQKVINRQTWALLNQFASADVATHKNLFGRLSKESRQALMDRLALEGRRMQVQQRTLDSSDPGPAPKAIDVLVGQMSKQERQDLLDRLALENQKPTQSRDLDMWSVSVVRALEATIGGSGRESYGLMLCKRQMGLSSTWRPIEAFMCSSGLMDLSVVERQAVYNLLASLIVEAAQYVARRSGAPLSLKLMAAQTGQVGGIFERAFPGYIAAGLAPVVARQSLRS